MSVSGSKEKPSDVRTHILSKAQQLIAARGFAGVGLSEILADARVPKGSFYHYFGSKEVFGSDLLKHYFANYLAELDVLLSDQRIPARQRLAAYWRFWRENQEGEDHQGKCLAVKLAAEVSDISEDMRLTLKAGTSDIIGRLAAVVKQGFADGSIDSPRNPYDIAETLYHLWMGASIMTKISRGPAPFDSAAAATEEILSGH